MASTIVSSADLTLPNDNSIKSVPVDKSITLPQQKDNEFDRLVVEAMDGHK
jgi:hypothetical protein